MTLRERYASGTTRRCGDGYDEGDGWRAAEGARDCTFAVAALGLALTAVRHDRRPLLGFYLDVLVGALPQVEHPRAGRHHVGAQQRGAEAAPPQPETSGWPSG